MSIATGTGLAPPTKDYDDFTSTLIPPTASVSIKPATTASSSNGLPSFGDNEDSDANTDPPALSHLTATAAHPGASGPRGTATEAPLPLTSGFGGSTDASSNSNSTAENVQDAWYGCRTYGWTSKQCENRLAVIIVPIVVFVLLLTGLGWWYRRRIRRKKKEKKEEYERRYSMLQAQTLSRASYVPPPPLPRY